MEIKVGDKFKVINPQKSSLNPNGTEVIYTVTIINGERIHWDCTGRKIWYKIVNIKSIIEWVEDGRLQKAN